MRTRWIGGAPWSCFVRQRGRKEERGATCPESPEVYRGEAAGGGAGAEGEEIQSDLL